MSVSLSYSPSTAPCVVDGLVTLGSNIISPLSVSAKVVVDKISSLTTTPTSPNPALFNLFFNSLANLLVRPSSTVSLKSINLASNCLGGNTFSCLTSSDLIKFSIASFESLFLPVA